MMQEFSGFNKLRGILNLPGDKSISHRSVMLAGLADGVSVIENLSNAEDVNSTIKCFSQLGCRIDKNGNLVSVTGKGYKGFQKPSQPLDAGNSGTTARLISGILCAQDFETTIIGDASLSKRPMKRIIEPLNLMGASITATESMTLPLIISPVKQLKTIKYELPVASAQVKSALLLAGLHLDENSEVIENILSRNHTELMLNLSVKKIASKKHILVSRKDYPSSNEYFVPSDISTAAFFMVLALLLPDSELTLRNLSLNETRIGIVDILMRMGGNIKIENQKRKMNESYGDLCIFNSKLKNIEVPVEIIPNIIDEIPILSIAGILSEGEFSISGAEELRYKETDRINAMCHNFRLLGLKVDESKDGFSVSGRICNENVVFESFHDHRIAMSFGVLSIILGQGRVNNFDCVRISNPNFISQIQQIAR